MLINTYRYKSVNQFENKCMSLCHKQWLRCVISTMHAGGRCSPKIYWWCAMRQNAEGIQLCVITIMCITDQTCCKHQLITQTHTLLAVIYLYRGKIHRKWAIQNNKHIGSCLNGHQVWWSLMFSDVIKTWTFVWIIMHGVIHTTKFYWYCNQ